MAKIRPRHPGRCWFQQRSTPPRAPATSLPRRTRWLNVCDSGALALIGYARVSTEEQQTDPQLDTLRAAGCQAIFEERASGGSRSRIELARCLERIGPGDTLVVVRIDRLARSLSHLLEVIERLRAQGA